MRGITPFFNAGANNLIPDAHFHEAMKRTAGSVALYLTNILLFGTSKELLAGGGLLEL